MPIRIGVKYCGGCREQFARKNTSVSIQEKFSESQAIFEKAEDGGSYDALMVVCGCPSRCADISKYSAKETIMLDSEDRCSTVLSELQRMV